MIVTDSHQGQFEYAKVFAVKFLQFPSRIFGRVRLKRGITTEPRTPQQEWEMVVLLRKRTAPHGVAPVLLPTNSQHIRGISCRALQFSAIIITCKRGSAKHSVKDDHAFLWEHAIFSYPPSRNPSTDQDEILHD